MIVHGFQDIVVAAEHRFGASEQLTLLWLNLLMGETSSAPD